MTTISLWALQLTALCPNQKPMLKPCFFLLLVMQPCTDMYSLQYLSITRPDLAFAVSRVAQHMHASLQSHWVQVKQILRYIAGTANMGIYIQRSNDLSLSIFCDADLGGCKQVRKSTICYAIYAGPNLVSWSSKKHRAVSRSSTEAEYPFLATSTSEVLWLFSVLKEIGYPSTKPPSLWCDNLGATYLTGNHIFTTRSRHLEIEFHFVRDLVARNQLVVNYISTDDQIADLLTKPLPEAKFHGQRDKLTLFPLPLA